MAMLMMMRRGRYTNRDAVEKVIRYITRTRPMEDRANELITWGGMGIATYQTPELAIEQFCHLQTAHGIASRGGSRIFHEVLGIKEEEFAKLGYDYDRVCQIAMNCAKYYYAMGHQVIYAIHHAKGDCQSRTQSLHIHFVVNAINFLTGNKWHTNMRENHTRVQIFNDYMRSFMIPDAFETEIFWN
ncbi:MAG: relaxase/mobilization nuclease domain-containing protein [Lachnospiraceae bacterium]|nr:relaxase/mobilization nuclease domain-containing protein [Lachnospiraceae bacterium]